MDKLLKNKKLLYIIGAAVLVIIIAVIVICTSANRYSFVLNEEEDGYIITNYDGWSGKVKLPAKHKGRPVIAIGENAFANEEMHTVILSDSIKDVGYKAFFGCKNLVNIQLNDGLTALGVASLGECDALVSVTIPDSISTIRPGTFENSDSLRSVKLPKSLTAIHHLAFMGCPGVSELSISDGNEKYRVQSNCLIEISSGTVVLAVSGAKIPDDGSITAIGEGAFMGLNGIRFLTIPESVTHIGVSAFEGCPMLQEVEMKGVKTIGQRAFFGCRILSNVVIGNELSEVGAAAFGSCNALMNVYFLGGEVDLTLASIGENNSPLSLETVYFYSETKPEAEGRFWHYDEASKPAKW